MTNTVPVKFMVLGRPGKGKSRSLKGLKNQDRVLVINGDKKELPFLSKITTTTLTDPLELITPYEDGTPCLMDQFEEAEKYDTCVIDTISFILNQYEDTHIANARDTRAQWGEYARFVRDVFNKINESKKNWIIMCHTMTHEIEETNEVITQAFCKGSVAKIGMEAAATSVIYAKTVPINKLTPNEYLNITQEEREDGCKHVFQTRKDKQSRNESMKFIEGVFTRDEKFIDNNCQHIFSAVDRALNSN